MSNETNNGKNYIEEFDFDFSFLQESDEEFAEHKAELPKEEQPEQKQKVDIMDRFDDEDDESVVDKVFDWIGSKLKKSPGKRKKKRPSERFNWGNFGFLGEVILIVAVIFCFFNFVGGFYRVGNDGMKPNINTDDYLLYTKIVYYGKTPERGDIIIYKYKTTTANADRSFLEILFNKSGNEKVLIGRVVGLPGDEIKIEEDGKVYINGIRYENKTTFISGQIEYPLTVPENSYFVLYDNSEAYTDSRLANIACINQENIMGRVIFKFWPLKRIGVL